MADIFLFALFLVVYVIWPAVFVFKVINTFK